ncbi:MAG: efflux RND transporter periplasmic adaptor subunit [Bacillota bacterium]|nr:efflux RND transporter periplasmic adaptor subunit [Bacillota bacterium]
MKKRLWWGIGIFVILALAIGAWWFWGRAQGPLKVKAIAVAPISMQEDVYATGSVVPVSSQDVRVLTPGRVAKVAVKVGDAVKSGQTLVTLDTTLADAQVAQAKANVEAAQTSVNAAQTNLDELKKARSAQNELSSSAKSLLPGFDAGQQQQISTPQVNPVSSGTVQQAEGVLAQSKSALKQAQEAQKVAQAQQGQLIYKSALAGTVLEVNAQEGNPSPVQQPLVLVANLSQMNVEAQLNEVDAGKVQLGRKVKVTSRVLGNTAVQGTVAQIAPEAVAAPSVQGNASPTVGVKIHLDQVPSGLKPGFSVSIQVIVASKEGVLAVPQEALFQEGSKNFVYLIQGGRLQKTEVKVGIGNETHQEITSGLKAGDLVVQNPSNELSPGLSVTPDTGSAGT